MTTNGPEEKGRDLPLVVGVLTLLLAAALVALRTQPPAARPADTPASEFSAARAHVVLARLLGDGSPHPTGSAANARVRDRVVAELRGLGLAPAVDSRLVCGGWGRCATVDNVLARIPGTDSTAKAVLLAVHYDSVAAGPGASDDGAGVAAAVEVARAVLAGPRLRRDLLVLVDDGEEQGLLGAESFVQRPWAARVGVVVNVEARGTSGPSFLFELSPGNSRLVAAAARSLPRPTTNSIYYTVYRRLPNDTDLTVFKRAELPGVNFGFIGDPLRYHTPRDDLRHHDPRSLQHHGDNALAMVRALGADAGEWSAPADVVFFDLLGFGVVRWPAGWTLPLALLALAMVAVAAWGLSRREARSARGGWAAVAVIALLVAAGAAGWALLALLRRFGAVPYDWVAQPMPLLVAFWALPLAVVGGVGLLLGDRLTPRGAWAAAWITCALLALALAVSEPGVSYPFLVPALLAGLVGLAAAGRAAASWLGLPALLLQALLVFPFAWKLFEALGRVALPGIALLVAVVLAGLLPAVAAAGRRARLAVALAGLAGVVGGAAGATLAEPFTADSPLPLSLILHHDGDAGGGGRWLAPAGDAALPEALQRAAAFAAEPVATFPWSTARSWAAPAGAGRLPPLPELRGLTVERTAAGGLRLRGRLVSPRGAPGAGVYLPARRFAAATLGGVAVRYPPRVAQVRDDPAAWLGVEHVTLPPAGADLELLLAGQEPVELHVWDGSPGLGPGGAALLSQRPAWAVPLGRGDRTVVSRRLVAAPAP